MSTTSTNIVLSRAEALAVAYGLAYTDYRDIDVTRDGCYEAIRRLQLEARIRDAGDWWEADSDPAILDPREKAGMGRCPDSFAMAAEGVQAIIELMPDIAADLDDDLARLDERDAEDHERFTALKTALVGLAARLGVALPAGAK